MPIYDFETKNTSFIEVHNALKEKGIKNNKFHLLLNNPELQGVDPYANDLTDEQKRAIMKECSENICYYLREVLRVEVNGSRERFSFHLDIGSVSALYCFMLNTTFYLMKPKYCHHTTDALALLSHAFKFGTSCEDFTFLAHDKYLSRQNIKIMKSMLEEGLPQYMVSDNSIGDNFDKTKVRVNDVNTYIDPVSNNVVVASNSPNCESQAENIGNACIGNYRYFDEFEYIKCPDTLINASMPSYIKVCANAKIYGLDTCMILTSRPGKLHDVDCRRALKIATHFTRWRLNMLDLSKEEFLAYVSTHSITYRGVYICYDYKDLGLDEKWFKHSCQLLGGIPERIEQELLLRHV